ncbi:MAG: hypothetical protein RLY14_1992 [Planctomycetota bacterium]|jgi:hypothetical protein
MKHTALTLMLIALALLPQIALAHPGHSDFTAHVPQQLTVIDGMLHSLIALPSLLLAVALGTLLAKSSGQFRLGIALVAPIASCAIASYHLDAAVSIASQLPFLVGAAFSGWIVCQATHIAVQTVLRRFASRSANC